MPITQYGLLLDIVAVLILALDDWIKLRTIEANSIRIGHGQVGCFLRFLFAFGYPLLILGFVLQFIGSAPSSISS